MNTRASLIGVVVPHVALLSTAMDFRANSCVPVFDSYVHAIAVDDSWFGDREQQQVQFIDGFRQTR